MRKLQAMYSLLLVMMLAGCAANRTDQAIDTTKSADELAETPMPAPPKDATYTIYCQALMGPDHVAHAKRLRGELLRVTGMKDWYLIHSDDRTVLYYGFYRCIDPDDRKDGDEGLRAQRDKAKVESITDTMGNHPFTSAIFMGLDLPDPTANPAWDLRNAKGYWSVEIAVYKDSAERKQAAVDAVREARAQGIPAYYYHAASASSVCVGAWPREAVDEVDPATANDDPTQDLVVVSPGMSQQMVKQMVGDVPNAKQIQPQATPVDPSLVATLQRYPQHLINGEGIGHWQVDGAGNRKLVPDPSFLVRIPHDQGSSILGNSSNQDADQPAAAPAAGPPDSPAAAPGVGPLRSIGE